MKTVHILVIILALSLVLTACSSSNPIVYTTSEPVYTVNTTTAETTAASTVTTTAPNTTAKATTASTTFTTATTTTEATTKATTKATTITTTTATTKPAIPDLIGAWTQKNKNSEDTYQAAEITDDTITVWWMSDGGKTKALYWAGSFTPPADNSNSYSWESKNDTAKTSSAILASGDETKTFAYKDGIISYEVSAMGITTTVEIEKESD